MLLQNKKLKPPFERLAVFFMAFFLVFPPRIHELVQNKLVNSWRKNYSLTISIFRLISFPEPSTTVI